MMVYGLVLQFDGLVMESWGWTEVVCRGAKSEGESEREGETPLLHRDLLDH